MATNSSLLIEFRRKGIHALALIIPAGLFFLPEKIAFPLLFGTTAASVTVELLRLRFPVFGRIFNRLFGILLRPHESSEMTGSTFLLLAASFCTLTLALLSGEWLLNSCARTALFYAFSFLILGDAAAAIFGKLHGKRRMFGEKTWVGFFACLLTCILFFLVTQPILPVVRFPLLTAGLVALLTALLEALPIKSDDNLRVAPVCCFLLYAILTHGRVL